MKHAKQTRFARYLRSELKKAKLSLGATARLTGISKSALSRIVNGQRDCRSTMLARLVVTLELDPAAAVSALYKDDVQRRKRKKG